MSKQTIGPRIKQFRKEKDITQEELANALGYSGKSVISHIEKGDADMTYDKILLLLRTYALDANRLFDVQNIDKKNNEFRAGQRKYKKVVVYIHGLHGSYQEANDYKFFSKEYDVVGLDYKDANPWELKATIQNEFKRITKNYKGIIVIANSIGAFYAYAYLSEFDISQAFFISPIADMLQLIINIMKMNGISEKELEKQKYITLEDGTVLSYSFYQYISSHKDDWKIPTEILYGSRDNVVYIESIAAFLENHPLTRLTIKQGSEHYFHTEEEKKFIKEWILRNIK